MVIRAETLSRAARISDKGCLSNVAVVGSASITSTRHPRWSSASVSTPEPMPRSDSEPTLPVTCVPEQHLHERVGLMVYL